MSVTLQPPQQQQQPHPAENDNSWSDDIEYILETIRLNSTNYSRAYKKYYFLLKGRLSYFRVPIVVISAINGVVSVGLQQYIPQNVISLTTCALGLVCSIIGSIELYLSVQKTMENALSRYKDFYLLAVDIYKTLQLQRHHRPYPAKEYLDQIFNLYVKYAENSDPIYEDIRDKLTPLAPKPPSRWRSLFSSAASPASNALVLSRPTSSSVSRSRPSSAESTAHIRRHDSNSIFSSGGDDDTSTYEHKDGGNEEENIEEEYFIERIGNINDNTAAVAAAAATVNAPSYLGGRKRSFDTTQQQRYLNLGDWIRPSSATSGGTQVDVESQQQQQQNRNSTSSTSSDDEPLGDFNAGNNYHMYTHGIRHRTRHNNNNNIHIPTQSTSQITPHYSFNKIVVEPVANLLSSAFATATVTSNSNDNNNDNNDNDNNNDNKEVTKVQTYDHHEPFLTPLPQPRAFVSQYPTLTPTLVQTAMQQTAMQQPAVQQQSIDVTSISPSLSPSLSPPVSPPQSPNASSFSPTIDSITITQPSNEPDSTANVNADD